MRKASYLDPQFKTMPHLHIYNSKGRHFWLCFTRNHATKWMHAKWDSKWRWNWKYPAFRLFNSWIFHWWAYKKKRRERIPSRKYFSTSVPSEQLFSTTGNVVSVKRSALLPENVEKLIFLHDNLPPVFLPYKWCNEEDSCDCDSCKLSV